MRVPASVGEVGKNAHVFRRGYRIDHFRYGTFETGSDVRSSVAIGVKAGIEINKRLS